MVSLLMRRINKAMSTKTTGCVHPVIAMYKSMLAILSYTIYYSYIHFVHIKTDGGNSMSRTFAYCRVSTGDQTTDNQVREIAAAGFDGAKARKITETISRSVAAIERKRFV